MSVPLLLIMVIYGKKTTKIEKKTHPTLSLLTWLQQNLRISTNHKYRIYMDAFLQPDVLKTWRFVNLTFCKPDVLKTWRFVNLTFQTFWNRMFWNLTFWNLTFCGCTPLIAWLVHMLLMGRKLPLTLTNILAISRIGTLRQREISQADLWPSTATSLSNTHAPRGLLNIVLSAVRVRTPLHRVALIW